MKDFNIHRFNNLMLIHIVSNGKRYAMAAAVGLLAVIVPCIFTLITGNDPTYQGSISDALSACLLIYLITCGAFIVSDVKDKNARISSFILPASKLEKFVSRYISLLIVLPLTVIIGIVIGDIAQLLLCSLITGNASSVMLTFLRDGAWHHLSSEFFAAVVALWLAHSIYLLFGTIFRRHAWIKSGLTIFAALSALAIIFFVAAKFILDGIYGENNYNVVIIDSWWTTAIGYVVSLALIAFNYWASYRIYARMQAVNTKWYNF